MFNLQIEMQTRRLMRTTSHAQAHYYGIFNLVHVAEADIIWDHVTSCLFLGYMPSQCNMVARLYRGGHAGWQHPV